MAKEVNIVVLCDEIYQGLKAKGCGMSPVEVLEKTDLGIDKSFNGTFVNIVFDALEKAKR
jgi:aspartate/methionine/tyrosine aminotransferase